MKAPHTRPSDAEVIALISSNLQMLNRLFLGSKRERTHKPRGAAQPGQQSLLSPRPTSVLPPEAQFVHAWLSRRLFLPLKICTVKQLHAAYIAWTGNAGVLDPPLPQVAFTLKVRQELASQWKLAPDGEARLSYKTVKVLPEGHTIRCWIPAGEEPPDGVSLGAWAGSSIKQCDAVLDGLGASPARRKSRPWKSVV